MRFALLVGSSLFFSLPLLAQSGIQLEWRANTPMKAQGKACLPAKTSLIPSVLISKKDLLLQTSTLVSVLAKYGGLTGASFSSKLTLEIQPRSGCAVGTYGKSFSNAAQATVLAGDIQTQTLTLDLRSPHKSMAGIRIIGTKKSQIRIPGQACALLTNILIMDTFETTAQGSLRQKLPLPNNLTGSFNFQAALLLISPLAISIETSNGLELVCRWPGRFMTSMRLTNHQGQAQMPMMEKPLST